MIFRPNLTIVLLSALIGLALTPGPSLAQETQPVVPNGPWLQVETKGFLFFGNASEERLRGLATDGERLRHAIGQVLPGVRLDSPIPTLVFALRDPASFDLFQTGSTSSWTGDAVPVQKVVFGGAGFFAHRDHASYFVLNAHPDVNATRILYNQYIHRLLRINDSPAPAWLRFGLAELFSTFQVIDGVGSVGEHRGHTIRIQSTELMPIPELVRVTEPGDTGYRGFDTQSETLLRYLLDGPEDPRETREGFKQFVRKVYAGVPPEQAFEEALGEHFPADGRAQLLAFRERPRRAIPLFAVKELPQVEMTVQPMTRQEVLSRLGDLVLHTKPVQASDPGAYFHAALSLEPEQGLAHAGLGVLALEGGDSAAALTHFEKATRALPEDFQVHFLYGSSLLESLDGRRPKDKEASARLERAREMLERATELNPELAAAWVELSRAYGLAPKPLPEELELLQEAMERFPDRVDLISNALLAYGRRADGQSAGALYERLEALGADEVTLTRGREVLLRVSFFEADRLIRQGDHNDAIGLFARIQSQTTDPRLRQQVTERIALLERAEEYNRFIDLLLECQQQMANGELEGAETRLEALRELARPGKQSEVVEDLAAHLAKLRSQVGG